MRIWGRHYCCTHMRVYEALIDRGIMPIRITVDVDNPRRRCWIFEITPELRSCLEDYFGEEVETDAVAP